MNAYTPKSRFTNWPFEPVTEGPPRRPSATAPRPAPTAQEHAQELTALLAINGLLVELDALEIIQSTPDGQVIDWTDLQRNGPPSCPYVVQVGKFVITAQHWKEIAPKV